MTHQHNSKQDSKVVKIAFLVPTISNLPISVPPPLFKEQTHSSTVHNLLCAMLLEGMCILGPKRSSIIMIHINNNNNSNQSIPYTPIISPPRSHTSLSLVITHHRVLPMPHTASSKTIYQKPHPHHAHANTTTPPTLHKLSIRPHPDFTTPQVSSQRTQHNPPQHLLWPPQHHL